MEGIFDKTKIIDCGAPEYFITRIGYMEMLPGPCIRYWAVIDHPTEANIPGDVEVRFKFVAPVETVMIGRAKTGLWLAQKGLKTGPRLVVPDH